MTSTNDMSLILAKAKKAGFFEDVKPEEVDWLKQEATALFGNDIGLNTVINSSKGGKRLSLNGDSIFDGTGSTNASVDSARAFIPKLIGTAIVPVSGINAMVLNNVPGQNAEALLANMDTIIAQKPDVHLILIGQNASASASAFKTAIKGIIDKIKATGKPMLFCTITPRISTATVENTRINTYNLILKSLCAAENVTLIPTAEAITDPVTGAMGASYVGSDETHPNVEGHLAIANAIVPYLAAVMPKGNAPEAIVGAPGLVANPLQTGGSGSTQPTGWSSAAAAQGVRNLAAVAPVANDGLNKGQWFKLETDATSEGGTCVNVMYYPLTNSPAAAEGDLILVRAQLKTTTPVASGGMKFTAANGGTDFANIGEGYRSTTPGTILRIVTLPANPTSPRLRLTVTATAGTVRDGFIGEMQAWNLTQLGLTGDF